MFHFLDLFLLSRTLFAHWRSFVIESIEEVDRTLKPPCTGSQ